MIEFLKVLILGIVEGVTEFLPISSTGHLILVHQFFSLSPENFSNAFDVIIQFDACQAVLHALVYQLFYRLTVLHSCQPW